MMSFPETHTTASCMGRLTSVLVLVLVVGCAPKPQPVLRVSVQYPGASTQDVEDKLALPIESLLAGLPDIGSITSICSAGKLEAYIQIERNAVPAEVRERVATLLQNDGTLPPSASPPVVEWLPQSSTIPAVQPTLEDEIVFDMNREATNKHGVAVHDVATILTETDFGNVSAEVRLEKLREMGVRTSDNSVVPLTELGELRIEKSPDKIVRTWP